MHAITLLPGTITVVTKVTHTYAQSHIQSGEGEEMKRERDRESAISHIAKIISQ